jgi:hypothetical protein
MTTPNSIIADLSHEIDRLRRISNLLLSVAIRSEVFVSSFEQATTVESHALDQLLGDLRYAIDEAYHG